MGGAMGGVATLGRKYAEQRAVANVAKELTADLRKQTETTEKSTQEMRSTTEKSEAASAARVETEMAKAAMKSPEVIITADATAEARAVAEDPSRTNVDALAEKIGLPAEQMSEAERTEVADAVAELMGIDPARRRKAPEDVNANEESAAAAFRAPAALKAAPDELADFVAKPTKKNLERYSAKAGVGPVSSAQINTQDKRQALAEYLSGKTDQYIPPEPANAPTPAPVQVQQESMVAPEATATESEVTTPPAAEAQVAPAASKEVSVGPATQGAGTAVTASSDAAAAPAKAAGRVDLTEWRKDKGHTGPVFRVRQGEVPGIDPLLGTATVTEDSPAVIAAPALKLAGVKVFGADAKAVRDDLAGRHRVLRALADCLGL
jgi:hypothetical protein